MKIARMVGIVFKSIRRWWRWQK